MNPDAPYPVQYSVDYPDRPLNRLTTFFRLFMVIPILIVIGLIEGGGYAYGGGRAAGALGAAGLVVLPTLLLILFRQKYPRWWFDWNLELMRFSARVGVYPAPSATAVPDGSTTPCPSATARMHPSLTNG